MKKVLKLTLLLVLIINFSFAANLDSSRYLYSIKNLSEKEEKLGYKIGDIFIDNIYAIKYDQTDYIPTAFENVINDNCGYDIGNCDKYMKYYIYDVKDKLI